MTPLTRLTKLNIVARLVTIIAQMKTTKKISDLGFPHPQLGTQ